MLQRAVTLSRYVVFVAVVASLAASVALILYEAAVVAEVIFTAIRQGGFQLQSGRALAIGLIEAIDVFLIAIVALVIGLGLHRLFVDEAMPLPRWLKIDDLEDLKGHLVSIVIAVLAVLFLRQAVEQAGDLDLLSLAAALAFCLWEYAEKNEPLKSYRSPNIACTRPQRGTFRPLARWSALG
jgi:uncharacterized membrane protein YqhA